MEDTVLLTSFFLLNGDLTANMEDLDSFFFGWMGWPILKESELLIVLSVSVNSELRIFPRFD
jgi:hypothetical protein